MSPNSLVIKQKQSNKQIYIHMDMKIEFQNSIVRFEFFVPNKGIKSARINPCLGVKMIL